MKKRLLYKLIILSLVMCTVLCGCTKEKVKTTPSSKTMMLQMRLPESFNPLDVQHQSVRDALSLCYEPLFALKEDMTPEGVLAQSITVSEDALSAIIMLKDSVFWHDGTELTSSDVVHTVNYIKENTKSPYYECVKNIATITALDPRSLSVAFTKPCGQIVYSLHFPIIASHNTNPDEKLLGTGPYTFEDYSAAVSLSLTKNSKWHSGKVACDKISVLVMRDDDVATSAFNSGSVNITTGSSYDLQNNTPKSTTRLTEYPSLQYEFLAFNHNSGIFSSQAIRAAVSAAINRSEIAQSVYLGSACEANSPVHPVAEKLIMTSEGNQYNLANAQEMLFLEGYSVEASTGLLKNENGQKLSFSLLVNSDNPSRIKTAELLVSQLFLAGIEVNITKVSFDAYRDKIQSGSFDAYLGGTMLSNMCDFEFFFAEGAGLNNYGYKSEYMSAALSGVATAVTEEARQTALAAFEEVFLREQPVCGIVFKNDTLITTENINVKGKPCPANPYRYISKWSAK